MEILTEVDLVSHKETLVHATFSIWLNKVTEIIRWLLRINYWTYYAITLIFLAIIYVLSLADPHIIVPIDVLSTLLAVLSAWKSSYSAPRVDNESLSLLRLRPHEYVHVEILQICAVAIEGRWLEVGVEEPPRCRRTGERLLSADLEKSLDYGAC